MDSSAHNDHFWQNFCKIYPTNDPGDTPMIPVKIKKSLKKVGRVSEYCIKLFIAISESI